MEVARTLSHARRAAGMTLRQMAEATGVPAARISDYEHGRHQPSATMLDRLLASAGFHLVAREAARAPGIDVRRNAEAFVDVLSLVDAMPPPRRRRPPAPTWAGITSSRVATTST